MLELTIDLGCFTFVLEETMSASTFANGIVFFDGDDFGDGNCWSALGLAPGFQDRV